MNELCISIALYCVLLYTQSALQSYGGGLSSTTTWQAGIDQSIIKHTKSACLPIIETKSILDHNRKLLQALDDDLKWVLSKNFNNYIFNVAWC